MMSPAAFLALSTLLAATPPAGGTSGTATPPAAATAPAAGRLDVAAVVERVQKRYDGAEDFRARRTGRNGGDRLRLEQGLLQRLGRADVGLGRAGAHRDAQAHSRKGDVRRGRELGLRAGVLVHLAGDHGHVERTAAGGQLDQFGRGAVSNHQLVSGRIFELGNELFERPGDATASQHLKFIGPRLADRHHGERQPEHRGARGQ